MRLFGWFRRPVDYPHALLICMRLADMHVVHPDQVNGDCAQCGEMVGIYPSGQRVIAERGADRVEVVCHVCRPPGVGGGVAVLAPGALADGRGIPRLPNPPICG